MPAEQPDFIQLIDQLDSDIGEIKRRSLEEGEDHTEDVQRLEQERDRVISLFFQQLSPWDKVRLARHPRRPYTQDLLHSAFDDFVELHGDRLHADDPAIVGGMGWLGGRPVVAIGHQKGRDIKERKLRNFGSARPEGYRKALRLMRLAEKLRKPVVLVVDTPAADCSVGAEERGISEAIARNLMEMFRIQVPMVVVVIGEGGSGGALGIAVGDRILMLEHAIYSVIPPEGCAAILWRDPERKQEAAEALRLTANDALKFGLIDKIIPEPLGGAHRDAEATAQIFRDHVLEALDQLVGIDASELLEQRYQKFRQMGVWTDPEALEEPVVEADKNGNRRATSAKKAPDETPAPASEA